MKYHHHGLVPCSSSLVPCPPTALPVSSASYGSVMFWSTRIKRLPTPRQAQVKGLISDCSWWVRQVRAAGSFDVFTLPRGVAGGCDEAGHGWWCTMNGSWIYNMTNYVDQKRREWDEQCDLVWWPAPNNDDLILPRRILVDFKKKKLTTGMSLLNGLYEWGMCSHTSWRHWIKSKKSLVTCKHERLTAIWAWKRLSIGFTQPTSWHCRALPAAG